ncbi:hypothetical protein ABXJ56_12445 [Microbacterium chocolatum]|uniref:hypothetical protein n=1 Tax=Microbacterium aurantiacum TaxID=162393 RepID=UPI00338D9EB7
MNSKRARLAELETELAERRGVATEPHETPAQRRLREARALRDALTTSKPADARTAPTVDPGTVVHCLDDRGITIPQSVTIFGEHALTFTRGDTFVVTEKMLDAARDKFGNPGGVWLAADEPEQVRRWGRVRLRLGAAPRDLESWTYGTPQWASAREEARIAAWAVSDPVERAQARRAVEERFGPAPTTSTTLNAAEDPSVRAAAAQRARLDSGGVRSAQRVEAREAGADR